MTAIPPCTSPCPNNQGTNLEEQTSSNRGQIPSIIARTLPCGSTSESTSIAHRVSRMEDVGAYSQRSYDPHQFFAEFKGVLVDSISEEEIRELYDLVDKHGFTPEIYFHDLISHTSFTLLQKIERLSPKHFEPRVKEWLKIYRLGCMGLENSCTSSTQLDDGAFLTPHAYAERMRTFSQTLRSAVENPQLEDPRKNEIIYRMGVPLLEEFERRNLLMIELLKKSPRVLFKNLIVQCPGMCESCDPQKVAVRLGSYSGFIYRAWGPSLKNTLEFPLFRSLCACTLPLVKAQTDDALEKNGKVALSKLQSTFLPKCWKNVQSAMAASQCSLFGSLQGDLLKNAYTWGFVFNFTHAMSKTIDVFILKSLNPERPSEAALISRLCLASREHLNYAEVMTGEDPLGGLIQLSQNETANREFRGQIERFLTLFVTGQKALFLMRDELEQFERLLTPIVKKMTSELRRINGTVEKDASIIDRILPMARLFIIYNDLCVLLGKKEFSIETLFPDEFLDLIHLDESSSAEDESPPAMDESVPALPSTPERELEEKVVRVVNFDKYVPKKRVKTRPPSRSTPKVKMRTRKETPQAPTGATSPEEAEIPNHMDPEMEGSLDAILQTEKRHKIHQILERLGFAPVRKKKHEFWEQKDTGVTVAVPHHPTIPAGTRRSMVRQIRKGLESKTNTDSSTKNPERS